MKKIAISGATGFLGSHLVHRFRESGHTVVVLKRSTSNTYRIDSILNDLRLHDVDTIDIKSIFEIEKPEIVIHTACDYGRKDSSLKNILETNLLYGTELMEASIQCEVELFINTSSLLPTTINNYSLSKNQFSQWLKMYAVQLNSIDLRIEHMVGPKDDANKFINWLIGQMMDGSNTPIDLTSGIQQRDFIYIDDVVDAYEIMVNRSEACKGYDSYDVGSGDFMTVKEFIGILTNELEQLHSIDIQSRLNFGAIAYRENEVMVPDLDNSELVELGWQTKVDVYDSIKKIVKQYQ